MDLVKIAGTQTSTTHPLNSLTLYTVAPPQLPLHTHLNASRLLLAQSQFQLPLQAESHVRSIVIWQLLRVARHGPLHTSREFFLFYNWLYNLLP